MGTLRLDLRTKAIMNARGMVGLLIGTTVSEDNNQLFLFNKEKWIPSDRAKKHPNISQTFHPTPLGWQ